MQWVVINNPVAVMFVGPSLLKNEGKGGMKV
jgi:hypothetical protein